MRGKKGFSLIELMIVLVILVFLALLVSGAVMVIINEAKGAAMMAEARAVRVAAQAVLTEVQAFHPELSDKDLEDGFTGIADDPSRPVVTSISEKMNDYLLPDTVLHYKPEEGKACVTFKVQDGLIVEMTYVTLINGKRCTIYFKDGTTTMDWEKT